MPESKRQTNKFFTMMSLHIAITLLWGAMVIYFGVTGDWNGVEPNEVGDFLAGAAAPAAFYWLIVGAFMQRKELELQRAELKETRLQLERQASAQEESGEIQRQVLGLNERERIRAELREELDTLPNRMKTLIAYLCASDTLSSELHSKQIGWGIPHGSEVPQRYTISHLAKVVSGWPHETHGDLLDCLDKSAFGAKYMIRQETELLRDWYSRENERARDADAGFFFQECERLGLIQLLETMQSIYGTEEDWDLYLGSH